MSLFTLFTRLISFLCNFIMLKKADMQLELNQHIMVYFTSYIF